MRDGIVITGMGVVTPVGIGVDTYWENLTAGVCGIGEITQIDTRRCRFTGQRRYTASTRRILCRRGWRLTLNPISSTHTRRRNRRSRRAA